MRMRRIRLWLRGRGREIGGASQVAWGRRVLVRAVGVEWEDLRAVGVRGLVMA